MVVQTQEESHTRQPGVSADNGDVPENNGIGAFDNINGSKHTENARNVPGNAQSVPESTQVSRLFVFCLTAFLMFQSVCCHLFQHHYQTYSFHFL